MPNGGALTIRATHENGTAIISVEDTGLGIPEENRNKIFKPHSPQNPKGKDPACRCASDWQKPIIAFESEIGKGSKFTVKVPIKIRRSNRWKQLKQSS
jgi:signal transduction histidine kinase